MMIHQEVLLNVAKLPTAEAQVVVVKQISERKLTERALRASATAVVDERAAVKITKIEANISQKLADRDAIDDELAAQRARVRKIQDRLAMQCVDAVPADAMTASPPIAPTDDEDVPAVVDRVLSPEDEASLAALASAWNNAHELKSAFAKASEAVRDCFIQDVLGHSRYVG
jgi:hypothetical protein